MSGWEQPASPRRMPSAAQPHAHPACAQGAGFHASARYHHSPAALGSLPRAGWGFTRPLEPQLHPVFLSSRLTCKSARAGVSGPLGRGLG